MKQIEQSAHRKQQVINFIAMVLDCVDEEASKDRGAFTAEQCTSLVQSIKRSRLEFGDDGFSEVEIELLDRAAEKGMEALTKSLIRHI